MKTGADVRVGISGWRYPPWRGVFYPKTVTQKNELAFASRMVRSVEINGSFYSLQRPSSYACWHRESPDDFVFSVKGGRFLMHNKKLRDCAQPLANFFASGVGAYLDVQSDRPMRYAVEVRHESYACPAFVKLLRLGHGAPVTFPRKAQRAVESERGVEEPLSSWDRWKWDKARRTA